MMLSAYIVFGICMVGCSATAWHLGRRVGIEHTVSFLIESGTLKIEDSNDLLK
jgi:hypothetical protein